MKLLSSQKLELFLNVTRLFRLKLIDRHIVTRYFYYCSRERLWKWDWFTMRMSPAIILFPSCQQVSFKRVSYHPSQPVSLLGCRGSPRWGKWWGAGGRYSNQPPSFSSAMEILYVPPLLIGIRTTNTQVQEDAAISCLLGEVNSVSDWPHIHASVLQVWTI